MTDPLDGLTDEQIRARKFAAIKKLCDAKNIPYPPVLTAYLAERRTP